VSKQTFVALTLTLNLRGSREKRPSPDPDLFGDASFEKASPFVKTTRRNPESLIRVP
jgi:hypothetical protein